MKEIKAIEILKEYIGNNPYIHGLKKKLLTNNKINLTDNQILYIINNKDFVVKEINKVIQISDFLGESYKKTFNFDFLPIRLLVNYFLGETEKTYHVYAKFTKKQKHFSELWLPKTQVIDDFTVDNTIYDKDDDIVVDFNKYKVLDKLNRTPFKHQEEGVKFLLNRAGAILGYGMGTGKTFISIISALELNAKKILIICPASLKENWRNEIECFTDDVSVIEGKKWGTKKFTIINYDILQNFHTIRPKNLSKEDFVFNSEFVNEQFDLIICDEAHYLKTYSAIRTQVCREFLTLLKDKRVWLLTGTPVANNPLDFYSLLQLINAPISKNYKYFVKRYCDGKTINKKLANGKVKKIHLTNGSSNLEELALKVKPFMQRKNLQDVVDMPDRVITPLYHKLNKKQISEYEQLWDDYLIERKKLNKKGTPDKQLVELILLRKFMSMVNIQNTIELTKNAIEEGHKVVIFCSFTEELNYIYNEFKSIGVMHNGEMTSKAKQNSVDKFQNDEKIKVFVGNIISSGTGITLTKGTVSIFNSLDWTPANIQQAIFRCYRIGQDKKVNIYFNITKDTVDEKIWNKLYEKSLIINTINDEKDMENIFDADFIENVEDYIDELLF